MLTYRIAVIAILAEVTFYFTGNAGEATAISVVFNIAGSLVYFGYERLWDSIGWGRIEKGLGQPSIDTVKVSETSKRLSRSALTEVSQDP